METFLQNLTKISGLLLPVLSQLLLTTPPSLMPTALPSIKFNSNLLLNKILHSLEACFLSPTDLNLARRVSHAFTMELLSMRTSKEQDQPVTQDFAVDMPLHQVMKIRKTEPKLRSAEVKSRLNIFTNLSGTLTQLPGSSNALKDQPRLLQLLLLLHLVLPH